MTSTFHLTPGQALQELPPRELARLCDLPLDRLADPRFSTPIAEARQFFDANGMALRFYRGADVLIGRNQIDLQSGNRKATFRSRRLARSLERSNAHALIVAAVTVGAALSTEASDRWSARPDQAWFFDRLGVALVESLIRSLRTSLSPAGPQNQATHLLPPIAPGHAGWDLAEQRAAFEFLFDGEESAKLQLTETGMLAPAHSMLVAFGVTCHRPLSQEPLPCSTCSQTACSVQRT